MKRNIGLLIVLLGWMPPLFAVSAGVLLQEKLDAIHSMRSGFEQVIYAKSRQLSSSSGEMALQRPGRFLWNTKEPMPQQVIADGTRLWVYDIDLEQVTISAQKKGLGPTAALFLSDEKGSIERDFTVSMEKAEGDVVFHMNTKSTQANIHKMILRFRGKTLHAMDLFDQLGQRTHIVFKRPTMNLALPINLFKFNPPKGVDVVKQDPGV